MSSNSSSTINKAAETPRLGEGITMNGWTSFVIMAVLFVGSACSNIFTEKKSAHTTGRCARSIRYGDENASAYNFVAKLIIRVGTTQTLCSATVISRRTLLTAAHCVRSVVSPADVSITLGNGQTFLASSIVTHPLYTGSESLVASSLTAEGMVFIGTPDIAVVSVARDFGVSPRALYKGYLPPGDVTLVGYGRDENEVNQILRFGTAMYVGAHPTLDGTIAGANLIVIPNSSLVLACPGDSGGPALKDNAVAGVFAMYVRRGTSDAICQTALSNTFISVAVFSDWIERTISSLEPTPSPTPSPTVTPDDPTDPPVPDDDEC